MSIRNLLFPLLTLSLLLTCVGRADDSDSAPPSRRAAVAPAADEDDGPASTLTFAEFKKAVAKVQMPGFHRMPEMTAEGDHGLILAAEGEKGLVIMAQRARIGEEFEKGAAGKLSRFKHQGHDAFFAQMTDDEGEEMAFLLVKYPEHRMGLFISGKPVMSRAELMKLLAQVEL